MAKYMLLLLQENVTAAKPIPQEQATTHTGSLARRGANPLLKHCHLLAENDGFAHRRANAWQCSTSAWRS